MPNLRGPDERVRHLYVEVIHSVLLYGALIWAPEMQRIRPIGNLIHRIQRRLAIRMIRACRTVSYTAATVLARIPPVDLLAKARKTVYDRIKEVKTTGVDLTASAVDALRKQARLAMLREWLVRLRDPRLPGKHMMEAILPNFDRWIDRTYGQTTFHLTQVLSGHGCFGEYLYKIGKALSPAFAHCDTTHDTVQHRVQDYAAWSQYWTDLCMTIGMDLSLPRVVSSMLDSETN